MPPEEKVKGEEEKGEEPLKAEITLKYMKLMRGGESFVIPRDYFRGVYDAMLEAVKLKDGESKLLELQKKAPEVASRVPQTEQRGTVGGPEWYRPIPVVEKELKKLLK